MLTSIANSLGAGSGLNVSQLVDDLASASRDPKIKRLDELVQQNQARISAVGQARSDLDSFATTLENLVTEGSLRSQPTISDDNAMGAQAKSGVKLGDYSGEFEILQLARAQSVYSALVPTADTAVGEGAMTLSVGGTDFNITIDSTNNSLTGLADAINATGSGVKASVINDAGSVRLVLKGATGADKAFTLTADAGGDPGLQQFAYGTGGTMTLAQGANDAQVRVDGILFTRNSNSIDDIVPGLTLQLKKAAPGEIISIGTTRPTDALRQTISDFVSVFNGMKKSLQSARDLSNGASGLRALERELTAMTGNALTSDPNISRLSDIGISTSRDGSLVIDEAKLSAVLASNPDAVEAMFNPIRDASHTAETDPGIAGALDAIRDKALASGGSIDGLSKQLQSEADSISKNRERIETTESNYRARLEKQFGSLDARLASLHATQSYLEQQIKLWNSSDN